MRIGMRIPGPIGPGCGTPIPPIHEQAHAREFHRFPRGQYKRREMMQLNPRFRKLQALRLDVCVHEQQAQGIVRHGIPDGVPLHGKLIAFSQHPAGALPGRHNQSRLIHSSGQVVRGIRPQTYALQIRKPYEKLPRDLARVADAQRPVRRPGLLRQGDPEARLQASPLIAQGQVRLPADLDQTAGIGL